jgi:hypothetical protein
MADIKLFRSERLTDNPDGGGLATSTVVVDGEVNNVFDDISRIDRVNGDLSLRKVFALADGANIDLFSGVHAIVAAPPLDPRVSAVIFRTRRGTQYAWGDERADAQAAVERYLDESVMTRMVPYDRQLEGQRTVLVFQRPELAIPEIGEVYALKDEVADVTEFIRVEALEHQVETFTDINGDFKARVITLTITQPLSREFAGSQPTRFFNVAANASVLRRTIASDAARYKGVVRLAEDAQVGDLVIRVDSIFAQLVPAATSEVGVIDAQPGGGVMLVETGPEVSTGQLGWSASQRTTVLPVAAAQGVRIVVTVGGAPNSVFEEQPDGSFQRTAGAIAFTIPPLPPERDRVTYQFEPGVNRNILIYYKPAVRISKAGMSWQTPVQIQNRGYVYTATLRPPPEPGALSVSYRALGRWYDLQDDGTGALRGDVGVGTGLVNYGTGSFNVSLGALPDVGSAVIASWSGSSEYDVRAGSIEIEPPALRFVLEAGNCEPGTLVLTWEAGSVIRTATADGAGVISGDGTGRVVHSTGEVTLKPALLPDAASTLTAEYQAADTTEETFTPNKSGSDLVLELAEPPRPGSLRVQYSGFAESYSGDTAQTVRIVTDDGAGGLLDQRGAVLGGSVNYSTGVLVIPADFVADAAAAVRSAFGMPLPTRTANPELQRPDILDVILPWRIGMTRAEVAANFVNGSAVTVRYKPDSASDDTLDEEYDLPPLTVDLTPRVRSGAVPGSLLFRLGTRTYYDRNGTLLYGLDPDTGAGTAAGSIDYSSGIATLTSWEGGIAPVFSVLALLTELAPLPVGVVHGRTPGSPLRPGTFYIQANRPDGTLVSGTADNNGFVTGTGVHGTVDVVTGVYAVGFGAFVLDSSLSADDKAEPWYNPANVDGGGYIWRPAEVLPSTIRFNCVVQVAATLDPEIIGVNPVRLPMDGRVPVIRKGDTLVIQDTQPYELPGALVPEQVVALPRGGLASVWLYDQAGLGVPADFYTVDKDVGEVTMAEDLDLTGYQQPLVALHTVEDMALCLDALITGEVSLGQALTHDYDAANATLSSAQVIGDVQARYQGLFAQNTWTGEWSDTLIGAPPTGGGQYNDATFPLQVLNRDTITQRWRLAFTSSTAFNVVGEELGVIGTGNTTDGAAPINPATGEPYFEISGGGFGAGWATGNNIRFNTVAAGGPIWIARTVRSGPATEQDDRIRLEVRWDKD